MSGTHRRGFTWKAVAEVLRMTRPVARAAIWNELRRSRTKKDKAQPSAIVIQEERSDNEKADKPRESGF